MMRVLNFLRASARAPGWKLVGDLYSTGIPAKLEWVDGALTGTPDALRDVDNIVRQGYIGVTPVGPFVKADRTDRSSAFVIALNVLRSPDASGDPPWPDIPAVPADAIA